MQPHGGIVGNAVGLGYAIGFARGCRRRSSPRPEIVRIECDAERVCWNESKLSGSHTNNANQETVHSRYDPSMPQLLAHQNRRRNGKHAGDIIKPKYVHVAKRLSCSEQAIGNPIYMGNTLAFLKLR